VITKTDINKRIVRAWVILIFTLALHVFDEAVNNFLLFYNPLVFDFRASLGFFPAPTFSYGVWISGLIAILLLLFALTPLIYRNYKSIRFLAIAFGLLMTGNALGHFIASIYFTKLVPGFWSSPLLLIATIYFLNLSFRAKSDRLSLK